MRTALLFVLLLACSIPARSQDRDSTHTVQAGETLFRIAGRYGLTVAELQQLNGLEGTVIRAGQVLRVAPGAGREAPPMREAPPRPPREETPVAGPPSRPPVDPGSPTAYAVDGTVSVVDVSFRLGVPADTLLRLNPDLPEVFAAGDSLLVPAGLATVTVRVRAGDTLYGLATRHGTTVAALRAGNGLDSDRIRVGQELRIPAGGALPDRFGLPGPYVRGLLAVYPDRFEGRLMASGRPYDPAAFTLAHPDLELGTVVLVTEPESGRSVFAEVADRMPDREGVAAEASEAVAVALGRPAGEVLVRIIDRPGTGDLP